MFFRSNFYHSIDVEKNINNDDKKKFSIDRLNRNLRIRMTIIYERQH